MAIDRPGDHVGNHGGRYTDIDGMSKQFTYIDHDKKTTISMHAVKDEEKWDQATYRSELIKRISEVSASLAPLDFQSYTERGASQSSITWNMDMLVDKGVPLTLLRDLTVILENRSEDSKLIR